MKSPFPGMDPYLERNWLDVHQRLCIYGCDVLQPQLEPFLLARAGERLVVESGDDQRRSIYPDVSVVEEMAGYPSDESEASVGIAEPLLITFDNDPVHEGYIQIIDPSNGNKVITVIEFLSVSNKLSEKSVEQYRQKQDEAIRAKTNIVEIDLLRAGSWVLLADELLVPARLRKPYRACIRRASKPAQLEYYHLPIKRRLPKIRIPLREHDSDALLDLQDLIEKAYRNGGYKSTDYSVPPVPPLDKATAEWANDLIAKWKSQ